MALSTLNLSEPKEITMAKATYVCRNCKAINEFDPDPQAQLLIEDKRPPRTFEIKSQGQSSKVYTLVCPQCGTTNSVTY